MGEKEQSAEGREAAATAVAEREAAETAVAETVETREAVEAARDLAAMVAVRVVAGRATAAWAALAEGRRWRWRRWHGWRWRWWRPWGRRFWCQTRRVGRR